MTRAQEYIQILMENVAEGQIGSDEHRLTFAKIGRKLSGAEDFEGELRELYKVAGFGQFALGLMWIADRVEQNVSKREYTQEEQSFVVSQFRYAVGDMGEAPVMETFATEQAFTPAEPPMELQEAAAVEVQEAPAADETPEMPSHLEMGTPGTVEEASQFVEAPPAGAAPSGNESEFAALMEKFVEAMQSGSDERDGLVHTVLAQSNAVSSGSTGAPDDLREFCRYLVEFLQYITENGFMDDVRVMNILSNVSGPISSWAQAAPTDRSGILAEGVEILRTFKSLFE